MLTSGLRFATRIVHLSFVPVIPGGKPPPKAAAIAAALAIYKIQNKLVKTQINNSFKIRKLNLQNQLRIIQQAWCLVHSPMFLQMQN